MLNLPALQPVLTSRYVTCISCEEKFAVSEGYSDGYASNSLWRAAPTNIQSTGLRYDHNRENRTISPQARNEPFPSPAAPTFQNAPPQTYDPRAAKDIICPRCGADNRNWVQISSTADFSRPRDSFDRRLPVKIRLWRQKYPGTFFILSIAIPLFCLLALAMAFVAEIPPAKTILLLLFIPVTMLAIVAELTGRWRKLRNDRHRPKNVTQSGLSQEAIAWGRGFILVLIAAFIVPVIFFVFAPVSFGFMTNIIQDDSEDVVEQESDAAINTIEERVTNAAEEIGNAATEANELLETAPERSTIISDIVENASEKINDSANDTVRAISQTGDEQISALENVRSESIETIKERRRTSLAAEIAEASGGLRFLVTWGLLVGLSGFLAVFVAMAGVKDFVKKIDGQLPLPIYHSVASMTRVAIWEAKHALEINEDIKRIQWIKVKLNQKGGVDLIGLYRDPPEFDMYGQPRSETVRAQKYTIQTDRWCRIVNASVMDVKVPRPAGAPAGPMPEPQPVQHDAPSRVRIRVS